ncbi:hypothetical protein GCM10023093_03210 [Nemorincola caseinilytica]|uniref:Glycosyltransferase RgtA/B/C/D-like domain-containing protein n=1 Tax=Nemorincola caseinilytica TaxID=2054315 RepID=A0ABP8N7C8_9BACT
MEFIKKYHRLLLALIPLISLALHWYVFDLDLVGIHVWRQTKTQQVINNFFREDMNIFHPRCNNMAYPDRLLLQEFPIMQWLFAVVHKVLGPSVAISRVLSFIVGLFSVYGMYRLARNIFGHTAIATICAWCFAFSPVFHYYMVNPMPDNFSMCTAIWSLAFFYEYVNIRQHNTSNPPPSPRERAGERLLFLSALFLCLATLAKLPFVIYGIVVPVYLLAELRAGCMQLKRALAVAGIYALIVLPAFVWYISVIHTWGDNMIIAGVTDAKESVGELFSILLKITVSMLPELLINYGATPLFAAGLYFMVRGKVYRRPYFILLASLGVVVLFYFFFEINAISTVHDYYMFPFLPPIFLLVAYGASRLLAMARPVRIFAAVCLVVLPVTAFIRCYSRWDVASDTGFEPAFYRYKDEIRSLTPPGALCIAGNDPSDMVLLYYIDRKGWSYDNDDMSADLLSSYMQRGAKYLYTTGNVDTRPGVQEHLGQKLFDKDGLRVYELK